MQRISDPYLRQIAQWYPTPAELQKALDHARERRASGATLQIRETAQTDVANYLRIAALLNWDQRVQ